MGSYKIRIHVEIVPISESAGSVPMKHDDGHLEVIIPESEASSIDLCERRLLQTANPVIRDALSSHLSALSKKKL
jgi:hypothetical protein